MATRLTKKEKGFAKDYLETGNATQSALKNYDTDSENTAAVIGHENLRKPKVREYLESKAERAAEIVFELAESAEQDNVRLGASKDILDRAGFKPIDKVQNLNINIDAEPSERIKDLADRLRKL